MLNFIKRHTSREGSRTWKLFDEALNHTEIRNHTKEDKYDYIIHY